MKRFRTAGRTFKLLVFAAIASGALILGVTGSFGATPSTPYRTVATDSPAPVDTTQNATQCDPNGYYPFCVASNFGERISAAGDVTGDGIADVFTSSYSQDLPASQLGGVVDNNAGMLTLISGATQRVVWNITPEPQADASFGFGFYVSVTGDVTGDGREDVAVGSVNRDVGGNVNQGRAYQINGRTGAVIRTIENPFPQANGGFGARIGTAGDVTGDRVPDVLIGANSNDLPAGCGEVAPVPAGCRKNQGQAFIFNGATGAKVRDLNLPSEDQGGCSPTGSCSFGGTVQSPGDVNKDGVADQTVAAYAYRNFIGRVYLFSGGGPTAGQVLAKIDPPGAPEEGFSGLEDPDRYAPGDLNADGTNDLYVGAFNATAPGGQGGAGRAWTFNGAATVAAGTGVVLYELIDPLLGENRAFGWANSKTDYNKDGRPDLFISNLAERNTSVYVFDGRNGSELKRFNTPAADVAADPLGAIGWSSRAPGDLNRDCEPDYVAGAPYQDVGNQTDQGRVYFFLSNGPSACPTVRPPIDYPPPPRPGVAAFAGCPASTANVLRGSAASNRITGTPRGDRIFAGAGNDVVDSLAGNDCVDLGAGADRGQGGPGRDRMRGAAGRDRISGSSGNDNLNGQSGNDNLNGGSGNDSISGSSGSDRINGGSGTDRISAGSGGDRISARDRRRDRISCGSGRDTVTADRVDRVSRSCERVRRR